MAVEAARSQAQDLQRALMPIMEGARSAASVARSFAASPSVFASQVEDSTVFLDVVVVGTGFGGGGIGGLSRGVRACVRLQGQVGSDTVAMSDVECPQQQPFGLPAYDKTVLLWG